MMQTISSERELNSTNYHSQYTAGGLCALYKIPERHIYYVKKLESERTPAPQGAVEYIICGLGNPGTQYEVTRHNIGFMTIDTLCEKYKLDCKKLRFKSLTCDAMISGKRCLIMKPTTFMNNSGEAVTEAMSFYKIPPERTIIVFDDISLEPGKLRIRRKGSDGGHNGIKSIIYLSGSDMFPRIKMGVGAKPHPDYNLADWVLGHFKKEQAEALETAMDNAVSSIELMVGGKMNEAMNKFNS